MKNVYKFHSDQCYGILEGLFLAYQNDVEELYGKVVEFGEILGEHSYVTEKITENNLYLVTDDENVVQMIEEYDLETGINPLDYVE